MEEVLDYFRALRKHIDADELAKAGLVPVKRQRRSLLPECPDTLLWSQRIAEYGLMLPGTWLNQPKEFMEDVEAAKLGRAKADREARTEMRISAEDINRRIAEVFKDVPGGSPVATRG